MCKELKLIIEVDGITHHSKEQWYKDKERQLELEDYGFTVLRLGLMKYSMLQISVIYCYTMINKYYKRSKISEAKFRHIIKCFAMDLTATETAKLSSISLRSITNIYEKQLFKTKKRFAASRSTG